jgi:tRNA pseudouridine38-40 synthase
MADSPLSSSRTGASSGTGASGTGPSHGWRLSLAWDGTAYAGWQRQPNGTAIQEVVEKALDVLFHGEATDARAAGRTDAGVHAALQWVAFDPPAEIDRRRLVASMNGLLPSDIACLDAVPVALGYSPREAVARKHYRYRILNRAERCPFRQRFTWHLRIPLDVDAMARGATHLVGRHDFSAFRAAGCGARTTVRTIERADVRRDDDEVQLDFVGDAFLRYQVRIMVGTLLDVGLGRTRPDDVREILASLDRSRAVRTAGAQGLWLVRLEER